MLYKAKLNNSSFLWFHSILSLVYWTNSQNEKSRTVRCKKTHSIPIGPANAYISVCLREIWPVLFLVLERKFLRLLTWAHFAINPVTRFAKIFYKSFISITSIIIVVLFLLLKLMGGSNLDKIQKKSSIFPGKHPLHSAQLLNRWCWTSYI